MLSSGENTDSIDNVNKTVLVPKNADIVLQILLNHASDPWWWIVGMNSVSHPQIEGVCVNRTAGSDAALCIVIFVLAWGLIMIS